MQNAFDGNISASSGGVRGYGLLCWHRFFFTSPPHYLALYLPVEVTSEWGEVSFIGGEVFREEVAILGGR